MKLTTVYREAWRAYREHFWPLMLTLIIQFALRCMALTPLLFLAVPQLKWLALLCVPLYVLIVLPARQNAAQAMQDALSGGSPFSPRLISVEDYGSKVLRGLASTLRMLLWCAPLIAGVALAIWATHGSMDGFTLYRTIRSIGGGNALRGVRLIVIGYLLTLVPVLLGCAFHCGARHAAALDRPRLTSGRHGRLTLLWLSSIVVFLPFLAIAAIPCVDYIRSVKDALLSFFSTFKLSIPSPGATVLLVAVFAVVLLLPAIPLHSLLPAVYMRAAKAEDAGAIGVTHDAA